MRRRRQSAVLSSTFGVRGANCCTVVNFKQNEIFLNRSLLKDCDETADRFCPEKLDGSVGGWGNGGVGGDPNGEPNGEPLFFQKPRAFWLTTGVGGKVMKNTCSKKVCVLSHRLA